MRVLILTEGGKGIGFGHITRMLAVYQAFEEAGVRPYMLVKGDNSVGSVLKEARWEILDWINDPASVKERFGKVDILMIDSYLAPREVYEYLSKMAKVPAYYDDFGRIEYPCGVVINGNIHAEMIDYPNSSCVNYLLGVKYLPMRREFWDVKRKNIREKIKEILITFGGEDIRNMTPFVLKILTKNFRTYTKTVVLGRGFRNETVKEAKLVSDSRTKFVYYPTAKEMKELMLRTDIAISAAGQTLYELARVGVPTVAVVVAENQRLQAQVFKDKEFLADVFHWDDKELELKLVESIHRIEQYEVRADLSLKGRVLVNGGEVKRLIRRLIMKI